LARQEGKD
jgi:hypothetical protein